MTKPHHNRRFIASLALEALVPLVDEKGQPCYGNGNGIHPGYRMLVTHGLRLVVAHGLLAHPHVDHSCSSLDIWLLGAGKVLSLRWAPLEIVSFRGGDWTGILIEIALERDIYSKASAEPLANLMQRVGARASR